MFGAGSCTGNPDDPVGSANGLYGYCSLSVGKNTQARGRISNAMGERCLSESRYSSTDGYKCIAGKVLPSHPDYNIHGGEGEEGRQLEHMVMNLRRMVTSRLHMVHFKSIQRGASHW